MKPAPQTFAPGRHVYVEHPWHKPICDAKVDDSGRVRTCCEPPGADVHQASKGKKPKRPAGEFG